MRKKNISVDRSDHSIAVVSIHLPGNLPKKVSSFLPISFSSFLFP